MQREATKRTRDASAFWAIELFLHEPLRAPFSQQRISVLKGQRSSTLRISTQEELRLTDNGEYNGRPTVRHNIASWRTTLWGGTTGWDLVVFDLETGVLRRVTTESHPGYKWGTVDGGWFVYQRQLVANWDMNQIFAKDLVAAGILDPTGQHVLPEPGGP